MDDCPLSTNLHYLTRKAPLVKLTALDDDGVIDFNDYAKDGDKVTIITTFPLTKDEPWVKWNMVVSSSSKKGIKLLR